MSCYSPKKGFVIGFNENGKQQIMFTDYDVHHVYKDFRGNWKKAYDSYVSPETEAETVKEFYEIPCGKCIGCRLDYSKHWADRCMLELKYHDSNYFITLTYNDEHLPKNPRFDTDTGELVGQSSTLRKEDFQKFMKRLRKKHIERYGENAKLRYFACGEYGSGSGTFRPHYHAILFGLRLDDLRLYKQSKIGDNYYTSDFLNSCWTDEDGEPIGYVVVGDVSYESCSYVARYVVKKAEADYSKLFSDLGKSPEFVLMSRRPGIAAQYYLDNPNLFDTEYINVSTKDGAKKIKPPRYFQKLREKYDLMNKLIDESNRASLELGDSYKHAKLKQTDLDYQSMLRVEELNKQKQISILKRRLDI